MIKGQKFTLHFATINTEGDLHEADDVKNLHYTLLLLIPSIILIGLLASSLFTLHFATINTSTDRKKYV